ncbi:VanZ family protein [Halorhodospira halophila]|uniref:VanZ family protein n=1 Tax=Halorhodospira halophila (strain DSM 244 / SL1) TaxID=349124 RepID=A1WXA2_HALHL|nr:VanZ family protein [Halorhodospira halophila]ABM62314.1 VanZ family protein [Halorhodospira halophila SL1]MBK1730087.1 hypothetical protein [Halorhodospira halophila]
MPSTPTPDHPLSYRACVLGASLSLAVIAYATLLPFEFRDVSLAQAWEAYTGIRFAGLTGGNYAQWVANILLYTPLGFFWAAWLTRSVGSRSGQVVMGLLAALVALATTMTIEFLQIWLPFRYPAIADMSGNFLGGVIGVVVWLTLRGRLGVWLAEIRQGGPVAVGIALSAYAVAYIGIVLLPFDLVVSPWALADRLTSSALNPWAQAGGCLGDLSCVGFRGAEVAASLPLGVLLAWTVPQVRDDPWRFGLAAVVGWAVSLELLNLFVASGVVEGRSALMRAIGIGLGLGVAGLLLADPSRLLARLRQWGPLLVAGVAVPYLLLLLLGNHEFGPYRWDGQRAIETLQATRLLPFYYHYHIAEVAALRSMLFHMLMYAPVGLFAWILALRVRVSRNQVVAWAAGAAVGLALLVEIGKLLTEEGRPDSSTLVLAGIAAATTVTLLEWLAFALTRKGPGDSAGELASPPPGPIQPGQDPGLAQAVPPYAGTSPTNERRWTAGEVVRRSSGGLLAVAIWLAAWAWPAWPGWLAAGLLIYAVLLWRYPLAWLWVLPPLVPVLDWGVWTGWVHIGEVDLFIGMTVAVTLAAGRWPGRPGRWLPGTVRAAWALLLVSTVLALAVALWPLAPLERGLLSHYATGWNALRVGSGVLFAALLWWVVRASPYSPSEQFERGLVPGMALSWLAAALVILRERIVYPGLLDFDSAYRISGWFSDMQVGGPSVEAFLVISLPFAILAAWRVSGRWLAVPAAGVVAVLGSYLVVVTYSRAGWLGLVVALGVLGLSLLWASRRPVAGRGLWAVHQALIALPFLVAGGAGFALVMEGTAVERWSAVERDLQSRIDHWQETWSLAGQGGSPVWGRGMGAFPAYYRYAAVGQEGVPANFEFARTGSDEGVLRIGAGSSLFVNQRLFGPFHGERPEALQLELEVRGPPGARLDASICEKPIRHSFDCQWERFRLDAGEGVQALSWDVRLDDLASGLPGLRRGLVFALSLGGGEEAMLEIQSAKLTGPDGAAYLRNPEFEQAGRHWYFTTDYLWPYRTENQWLEIYFDQGVFGLLAFTLFLLAVVGVLLRRVSQGKVGAAAALAALLGVLAIGVFSTVFFNPKIALLFYLVALLGVSGRARRRSGRRAPIGQP